MFCFQCQETAKGTGCEVRGVCGKTETVAKLQDLLIYTVKGISEIIIKGKIKVLELDNVNEEVLDSLFMTITNANFDESAIEKKIKKMLIIRNGLRKSVQIDNLRDSATLEVKIRKDMFEKASDIGAISTKDKDIDSTKELIKTRKSVKLDNLHDSATFEVKGRTEMLEKASSIGVLSTENKDIRSLRELITYGLKGMAAYTHHALNIGKENPEIYQFIYEALSATLNDNLTVDELTALTLKTGEYGVKAMALLDEANTSKYGNPEITKVNIGVRNNPAILISGHDLTDLEQLLEQTKDSGVDVYTHSEMLPAHYYPAFKKYDNFVGNYGNSWWKQLTEFESFNGPILFTTNCIVPPKNEEIRKRIFTTGSAGYPGCPHIEVNADGKKDFSAVIEMAKSLNPPAEIEKGEIVGGFAHDQVFKLADDVVNAVKSGAIKKFFVMAGCDGRMKSREYYTEFAEKLPSDTVILTAGCAKYRYNKLNLGDIGGIPRVLDAGQCNDSYSLAVIALKLKEIFNANDINELPIAYNIAWYEQKAVIVLLALLHLGVKNIHLGPTLPAFLSENVANVLVNNFGISGIGTVDDDIKLFLG